MTEPRDHTFWNEMTREMRRALHLEPLSDQEAEREYDEAPELSLSEDEINAIARLAGSAIPREPSYTERTRRPNRQVEDEVEEVLGLYRNEGELDPDVEERMRRQREEALADDDEEEDDSETDKS